MPHREDLCEFTYCTDMYRASSLSEYNYDKSTLSVLFSLSSSRPLLILRELQEILLFAYRQNVHVYDF